MSSEAVAIDNAARWYSEGRLSWDAFEATVDLALAAERERVCSADRRPLPAFADGPVADTAEPVAAEAGRPIPEPDRDDTHTMGHG